ncbi:RNA recognition motif domain-containing protein [Sulfuriroseicoccus oceanibius]|uniref:Uncharacterized protein n=1 Tax=Sulfuriroseicoccus oceanibius TaxID=2707525 RepID=A0A6B3L9B1_9BACT|nr:hypothetical protein [Sulfuriroseicoccus oceanibius]QQL46091.1 hypothetical protein G3M56_005785 [Sulfuriroseicoccus oceanibius]
MTTSTSSSSSRGGRRRSGGNRSSSTRRNNNGNRNRGPRKPKKLTFWQKVLKALGIEPKQTNKGTGRPKSVKRVSGNEQKGQQGGEKKKRAKRTPEIIPVESPRLYIGNLSYDASEADLTELFSGVGTVKEVEIISHRHTQRSKGYGFLEMTTTDEAKRAVEVLHDQDFMGRKLVVSGAKVRKD